MAEVDAKSTALAGQRPCRGCCHAAPNYCRVFAGGSCQGLGHLLVTLRAMHNVTTSRFALVRGKRNLGLLIVCTALAVNCSAPSNQDAAPSNQEQSANPEETAQGSRL